MRERTRGFAIATRDLLRGSGALARGRDELVAVADLVADSIELVDLLVDRGLRSDVRRSILDEILAGRIDRRILALVGFVIDSEYAGDIPEVLHQLDQVLGSTYVFSDGIEIATSGRARGYARAIMQDLDREQRMTLLDELVGVNQLLAEELGLRRVLSGLDGNAEQRIHIVEDLFQDRISSSALLVVRALVATTNPRSLEEALEKVITDCAALLESQVARVTLAREVNEVYRSRIASSLEHRAGHELVVEWRVDASLIGGMVAVVGDRVYDVSVARELQRAQQLLAGR